jgi:ABC-type uncharacterized transport system substrate-binding protein
MRRREFIAGTAAVAAMGIAHPICAQTNAWSPGKKRLVIFHPSDPPDKLMRNADRPVTAYFDGLKKFGYIEGQNLVVERYSALGQPDRIGELAREIIASHPDVILPFSGLFINKIMALTTSIPMVAPIADPVAIGWAITLARPDRNFTGVVLDAGFEIWGKRVQLLLETARKLRKVGLFIANPPNVAFSQLGAGAHVLEAAQKAAIKAAFVVVGGKLDRASYERAYATVVVGGEKIDRAACERTFELMEKEAVDGLVVSETAETFTYLQLIVDLAAKFRVPAIYPFREFVEVGGLMAYGVDTTDLMRRVGEMTGQVLKGTKPADIPFYQQVKYELVLNQKTAISLGLEFPPTLLTTADEVIE